MVKFQNASIIIASLLGRFKSFNTTLNSSGYKKLISDKWITTRIDSDQNILQLFRVEYRNYRDQIVIKFETRKNGNFIERYNSLYTSLKRLRYFAS